MIGTWLQKHRLSILFLLIALTLGGVYAAFKLPVMLFPSIQFPRIMLVAEVGDKPVDQMVIEVTQPLEEALRSLPKVVNIRSTSNRGSAELSINFDWHTDMVIALLQVQSAINQLLPTLPTGTTFTAKRMDPIVFPILGLSLTSTQQNLVALRDYAYYQLRPRLAAVPGVASIEILGGQRAEFQILIDTKKLQAAKLTFTDVVNALSTNNIITAVGRMEDHYRLYLIQVDTRLSNKQDIERTILKTSENGIVALDDVAHVVAGTVPSWTRVTSNGQDAVLVNILQQPGANTLSIVDHIHQQIAEFQKEGLRGVKINTWYDQSQLVKAAAISVRDAIMIGAFLAVIILVLFLRNFRMTLIVALLLPCVLFTATLILKWLNLSFNIMTLGGMAAAVGLIIDDGVVMLEHIMRRLSEQQDRTTIHGTVLNASMQMLKPLAGSSSATIIIFLPLAFVTGVTGEFFKALAITMAIALTVSFFFVFLAVPLLGERMLKKEDAKQEESAGPILKKLHHQYKQTTEFFITQPRWFVVVIVVTALFGCLSFTQVGSGFMPTMDEGGFIFDYRSAPGTSLNETDRLLRQVEKIVMNIPEVSSYSRRTGLQLGGSITEANSGDMFIHLKPLPRRNIHLVMADLRNQVLMHVPGLQVETAQLMEDMIGDLTAVPQPIEIKIFGDNEATLQQLAKKIAAILPDISGVVEVKNGIVISGDAINVSVDRAKAALLHLDPQAITGQIQALLTGTLASQIQMGDKVVGLRIWTPGGLRDRLTELKNLPIRAADGHYLSLQHVAALTVQQGQVQMTRENMKPMVAVTARIEGRDLGSSMLDIQTRLARLSLPNGVYLEYGGLYQEQQASFYQMIVVFISAIVLVSGLILYLYESITILLTIIFTIFLTLSGIFAGLWLTGTELNISSLMGMTMIIGIVTETAIFYFSELTGFTRCNAENIIKAGILRMRPILMTSIIAALALSPLALGLGAGSQMQQPLAIAIISGLIVAVPSVLLIMPVVYLWLIMLK